MQEEAAHALQGHYPADTLLGVYSLPKKNLPCYLRKHEIMGWNGLIHTCTLENSETHCLSIWYGFLGNCCRTHIVKFTHLSHLTGILKPRSQTMQ